MEGILCRLYNQYLSKGDYENFIEQLTLILNKKGKTFKIKRGGALRSIVRNFLIQVIIDGKSYILIEDRKNLKSVEEICSSYIEYSFYSNGKFLPRGIIKGDISDIYQDYKITNRFDYYYKILEKYYSIEEIAIIYERGIKKNRLFEEYYDIIDNSIKLYLIEEYNGAITTLLPCIEVILKKILNNKLGKEGYSSSSNYLESILDIILLEWQNIIYPPEKYWFLPDLQEDFKNLYLTEELSVMIKGFLFFLSDFLYEDTKKFKEKYPEERLNRHSILHGFTLDYGTKHNWLYLFGMIDFLLILSNFKLFKDGHNIHSIIKGLEYTFVKEKQNSKRKCIFEEELNYLKSHFSKIILTSLSKAKEEVEKVKFRESYIKEIIGENLKDNTKRELLRISYYYSWEYDYELGKTLKLKLRDKESTIEEKNLVNIYFDKVELNLEESYINYYLDLEKQQLEEII